MKSFRFFGPTRETTEEGDDVREPREGERTAVPGGNRQVVSRQLVSCGDNPSFRSPKKACELHNTGSGSIAHLHLCTLMIAAPVHGRANSANLLDSPGAATMDRQHGPYGMIPDAEAVCQTSEAAVDSGSDVYEKIKDRPEKEVASETAWNRYQRLVAAMESRGGEFNRKSVIEAIFRGSDLVYVTH
ncbi:hypothetical protein ALC57_12932 [Trachymyrmex cornetzi]|uniref:Uncharacterized protein n=2 Tax=Trachymyrmex cornetzi TaxID=471704 RepID=A0A195DPM6_9HYME|nr:hypothetical protein ALC57_12932 [Trachymyrmex cornetzi]